MFKHKKIYMMPIIGFLAMILITTLLLKLPICNKTQITNIDALFEATSAVTATGSSVKDLDQQFTFWGQLILLIAMQIGAVGFIIFFSLLFMISKRKLKLSDSIFLSNEINTNNYMSIKNKAKKIVQYTLVIEGMGAFLLAFAWIPRYGFGKGLWYSVFHSVSAFCNVGLDVFGSESLCAFQEDIYINCVLIGLMFLGSLGFFVLENLVEWITTRKKSKIQVESRLVLCVSFLIVGLGMLLIKVFDSQITILQSLFCVITARNTGLFTVEIGNLSQMSQFLIAIMMFIGGGPGSNAGGIRVVVFAILILTAISNLRNREEVVVFYRSIDNKTIRKATTIFVVDLLIVFIGMLAITLTDKQSLLDTLFYVVSTFSNTGLSGIDMNHLTFLGKCISIAIMYVGKIAPITLVSLFLPVENKKSGIKYPNMDWML